MLKVLIHVAECANVHDALTNSDIDCTAPACWICLRLAKKYSHALSVTWMFIVAQWRGGTETAGAVVDNKRGLFYGKGGECCCLVMTNSHTHMWTFARDAHTCQPQIMIVRSTHARTRTPTFESRHRRVFIVHAFPLCAFLSHHAHSLFCVVHIYIYTPTYALSLYICLLSMVHRALSVSVLCFLLLVLSLCISLSLTTGSAWGRKKWF